MRYTFMANAACPGQITKLQFSGFAGGVQAEVDRGIYISWGLLDMALQQDILNAVRCRTLVVREKPVLIALEAP
jgi:hypothetical protein